MRVGVGRVIACGVVLPLAVAAVASAQPMPPPAVPDVKATDTTAERAKLQAELLTLLKRMSAGPVPTMPPVAPVTLPPPKDGKSEPPVGGGPDRIREAMNLFRDGRFDAARVAFDQMPIDAMPKEDRAFVRYMLASCHRRLGNPARAEGIYREVANSGDDEFLAGYASQQLYLIGSERELQSQLEQLRSRAKSK
jgi:hypothetical protein